VDYTPDSFHNTYTVREVEYLLDLKARWVLRLHELGSLPCVQHEQCKSQLQPLRFNGDYVDSIVHKLGDKLPGWHTVKPDEAFYELHLLEWRARYECLGGSRYSQLLRRKEILAQCDALVESGHAHKLETLADILGKKPQNLVHWEKCGAIPSVKIGTAVRGEHYISSSYANRLTVIFNHWLLVEDVVERADVTPATVSRWISQQTVKAVLCPDRRWRISPTSARGAIARAKTRKEEVIADEPILTISAAARRLGVLRTSLVSAVSNKNVRSIRLDSPHGKQRIPISEVEKWEERFNSLNEPFHWLTPIIVRAGASPQTMTTQRAALELGLDESTIGYMANTGLLPYFLRSFSNGDWQMKAFVRRYILGLKKFAGGEKAGARIARQYLERCKEARQIV